VKRLLIPAAMVAFSLSAVPALADPLPMAEKIARPEERVLLPQLLDAIARTMPASATDAEKAKAQQLFDALLARLPAPTPLRGLVQFFRAGLRADNDTETEADAAIQESIRLLPDYSAPLLVASQLYAYGGQPGRATDYLLRASRIDPAIVEVLGDYEVGNMLSRLAEAHDKLQAEALSERLIEIGWSKGDFRTNSSLAMNVLEGRVERGDFKGAAAMVPKIVSPESFARLLTDRKYDPLRPTVEAWAGPRLEKQWPIFLREARAEWEASHDPETAKAYEAALKSAGYDATLAATFLPVFGRHIDPIEDFPLIFVASPLANSLAHLGRWDQAFTVLDNGLAFWPAGKSANALNLSANRGRLLFFKGDFEAAIKQFDEDLENARKWQGQVNDAALTAIHLYRACALEQLGRGDDAITSRAIVMTRKPRSPGMLAYLHLCGNDLAAARDVLLAALEREDERGDVIDWMQPSRDETYDSLFARTMNSRMLALKADKRLRAAVEKYGRILPEPINASAPPEAEFAGAGGG
jgi:tetratricopeptide (TPR) repeat protein